MRGILLATLFVLAVFAGCSGGNTSSTSPPPPAVQAAVQSPAWAVKALFGDVDPRTTDFVAEHDHANRTLHQGLSTPNFHLLGHDGLGSPYYGNNTAGTGYCGDVSSTGDRKIAVVQSLSSDVGMTVLDVTNVTHPVMLGELVLPFVFTYDSAIFADGKYAVIAGNPDLAADKTPAPVDGKIPFHATWRSACSGHDEPAKSNVDYIPYGYSVLLVDLTDPTNPTVADFYEYPAGRNVHSISTATIDGTRWVATSGLMAVPCTVPSIPGNPAPNPVPCAPAVPRYGNALSHYDFLNVIDTPAGAKLQLYGVYTPVDQTHLNPSLLYLSNGHTDATIEKHPVTGQTLAYLADWDGGLHIIALAGTQQFTALASWGAQPGGDPGQMNGHIHSVWPVPSNETAHHYLLVGQEVVGRPSGRPSGQVVILDITTPGHPVNEARWTLPIDVDWPPAQGELFSTHYPILVNDTLFVSMYHGGVWAADAHKENWPDLPSIGVFVPAEAPVGTPAKGGPAPEVLEVLSLGGDYLLIYDGTSGAYTVHFAGRDDVNVPPAKPWAENPWIG